MVVHKKRDKENVEENEMILVMVEEVKQKTNKEEMKEHSTIRKN